LDLPQATAVIVVAGSLLLYLPILFKNPAGYAQFQGTNLGTCS